MGAKKKQRQKVSGNPTERLLRKMKGRITSRQLAHKRAKEAEAAEIDRLNNLCLGDPEHADMMAVTWDPIIAWIDMLDKQGIVEYTACGLPILHTPNHASDEKWFEATSALTAVADCFELVAKEAGIVDESNGLRRIAIRLNDKKAITDADIAIARKSVTWMIELSKKKTPKEITEFTTAIAIRAQMQYIQETNQALAA